MSKISDILARVKDTENPVEDWDALIAEVETAHEAELSVRDAKVSKTLEQLTAEQELSKNLKVHNYDLIKQIPIKAQDDEDKIPDPVVTGVDSMFES